MGAYNRHRYKFRAKILPPFNTSDEASVSKIYEYEYGEMGNCNCKTTWMSVLSRKTVRLKIFLRTKFFSKRVKNICPTLKIFVLLVALKFSKIFCLSWITNLLLQLLLNKASVLHNFYLRSSVTRPPAYTRLTHFGVDLVYFHSSAINSWLTLQ